MYNSPDYELQRALHPLATSQEHYFIDAYEVWEGYGMPTGMTPHIGADECLPCLMLGLTIQQLDPLGYIY